ncbi:hypothetical protein TVAG_395440 [Trichomonas vaginalis G3]|uniref:Uncharacterized protein n=1 Tax=Trichomonas vaginalis (strain ATCC PRA-98 / G3) TaxID=412133 RepID=A2F1D3_TRIV3|nr:hypothetical protein TVAGG3_0075570 [Trichomonas vaginalis G3]EAY01297.1 hypothetical protein TVAG_395440 [Trichomonas vaginalis G3]KAI5542827.1 hypothetical protein TVAGG3_0075570 [Trichomonas vaginalis G3]|eukprot:XP_001330165.1 hypothetical protein [Trichomonas vaginalis G3]
METIIADLENNIHKLEAIEKDIAENPFNPVKQQELLTSEMNALKDKVLNLSKVCLTDINKTIEEYDKMTKDITAMEGSLKYVKEKFGSDVIVKGFLPPPFEPEKDSEQENNMPKIELPTGDYVLNFSALDQIGQTVDCVANNIEGMPLIREIPPDRKEQLLWSRNEDYFVEQRTGPTYDPAMSTFVQNYGIEPSLYPTEPDADRSTTQGEIEHALNASAAEDGSLLAQAPPAAEVD